MKFKFSKMEFTWHTALFFLFLYIHSAYSIKCYQCNSTTNPECSEVFDHDDDQMELKADECVMMGAKYCLKITGVWGGVVGTQRMCSAVDLWNQCQYVTFADHDRMYRSCAYTCSRDSCNSARPLSAPAALLLLLLPLLTLLARRVLC